MTLQCFARSVTGRKLQAQLRPNFLFLVRGFWWLGRRQTLRGRLLLPKSKLSPGLKASADEARDVSALPRL